MDKDHKPIFFISDIHLGAGTPEDQKAREENLMDFLDMVIHKGKRLYILGDLFDFWFEYRSVIPKTGFEILAKIKELTKNGVIVDFIGGNHDYWVCNFFSERLNANAHFDSVTVEIENKKFFLAHGDGLIQNDPGYKTLKRILRNKFTIALFRWIHPDIGHLIAHNSSKSSRKYTSKYTDDRGQRLVEFAKNKLAEAPHLDYVICGHSHTPGITEFGNQRYVNLGDWIKNYTYGLLENGEMKVKEWNFELMTDNR